jgi:hypothetical protein
MNFKSIWITLLVAKFRFLVVILMTESSYNSKFSWEIGWYGEKEVLQNISIICIQITRFPINLWTFLVVYCILDCLCMCDLSGLVLLVSPSAFGQYDVLFPRISCSCSQVQNFSIHFSLMKWPVKAESEWHHCMLAIVTNFSLVTTSVKVSIFIAKFVPRS